MLQRWKTKLLVETIWEACSEQTIFRYFNRFLKMRLHDDWLHSLKSCRVHVRQRNCGLLFSSREWRQVKSIACYVSVDQDKYVYSVRRRKPSTPCRIIHFYHPLNCPMCLINYIPSLIYLLTKFRLHYLYSCYYIHFRSSFGIQWSACTN